MATSAATPVARRGLTRDPVLLIPVVVAVGLATGLLGVDANVSGARIAADLALAWALAAAFVVVLGRPRWRGAGWVLAAAALALLGADLGWSRLRLMWQVGFVPGGV